MSTPSPDGGSGQTGGGPVLDLRGASFSEQQFPSSQKSKRYVEVAVPRLRGYGPLVGMVVAFLLMVALVPSKLSDTVTAGAAPKAADITEGKAGSEGTTPCPDRPKQVPENSYSPPCFLFTGDNGGATAKGVTATDILVSYRRTSDPDFVSTVAALAKADLPTSTPEQTYASIDGLVDYFNKNFQFYGRKIKLVPYDAKGTVLGELFGGGQDAATADAVKASTDLGVFADVTAITQPYNDALAKRKVVAFGAPYLSDEYFQERRPYAWSSLVSCTVVSKAATEAGVKQLLGKPAKYAEGNLKDKPRKLAIVAPDNPEYQRCVASGQKVLKDAGFEAESLSYSLDLSTLQNQAASLVSKLKADGITSVACACDPLLPLFLTNKAEEQAYTPEWQVMGTALTDSDFAGKLYNQKQWARAFGISALGAQLPLKKNLAYDAYKSVRQDEPVWSIQTQFFQLLPLALGLQMAGPKLTPESFEAGMFAYPESTGENGTWKFKPGSYTPIVDAKTVWWDPTKISPVDGKPGAYMSDEKRYKLGEAPTNEIPVFNK